MQILLGWFPFKILQTKDTAIPIILILLLVLPLSTLGQNAGRIVYKSLLTLNNLAPVYEELIFENNQASFSFLKSEVPDENVIQQTREEISFSIGRREDKHRPVFFINNSTRTILSKEFLTRDNGRTHQAYLVTEGFEIDWDITNRIKQISGHNARAAKADFRGRSYTAWFTTDIPVAFGPWKFQGLPGLVLLVTDSEGAVTFKVERIEIPTYQKVKRPENLDLHSAIEFQEFCRLRNITRKQSHEVFLKRIRAILPRGATMEVTETIDHNIERKCY